MNYEINPEKVKLFIEDNPVNCQFFSVSNLQILQNEIISGVYRKSNGTYKIGTQDENQLIIIMRSIYLLHSTNNLENIQEQIVKLNQAVLDYSVPNILTNILQYIDYMKDRESVPFLPNPINDNLYISLKNNLM